MDSRIRTAITMLALVAIVVGAAVFGWRSLTEPLPTTVDAACVATQYAAGDELGTADVLVSVLNAGTRSGLAERTMGELSGEGFVAGDLANAPTGTKVSRAEIWTDDPSSPAVKLVRALLGRARTDVVRRDPAATGVNVVVGDKFEGLAKARRSVKVRESATVCSPPA